MSANAPVPQAPLSRNGTVCLASRLLLMACLGELNQYAPARGGRPGMERMPPMCIKLPSIQRAGVAAAFAAMLLLHGPAAQAGEVTTTNCLHGFSDAYRV